MNFKYKCLLQSFFSIIPKGELANYLFQKYISKSLPPKNDKFLKKVNAAYEHYNNFIEYNQLETKSRKYYEFGAGWTLTIPISMALLNFEVFCIDIRKLIIPELIYDTLEKFKINTDKLPIKTDKIINETVPNKNLLHFLKDAYNLNYIAPGDARQTGFADNTFDFISSTSTLEHIPKNDLLLILKECYRILNKGGITSMIIDYQDQWSYFDKNISYCNFLKYSSKDWKKYNPSLQYQNRLRHSDYMELISATGFKVVKVSPRLPDDQDKKILKSIKIAEEFKNYNFDDLAIRYASIVLQK